MAMLPSLISVMALAAASVTTPLAGVSDEETTISSAADGAITDYHFGNGDVIFVRDRTLRWYRVQLNKDCLAHTVQRDQPIAFESGFSQQIDRFTRVHLLQDGVFCNIDSIRRSAAPPQVDSKSVVTLD